MKCCVALVACLVSLAATLASAGHLGGPHGAGGLVLTGQSSQFREQDSRGNYNFGYDESHATGSSGRREERHGDVVTGSYTLAVHDGRARRVHYVADRNGFRATVISNEPGVGADRDPAAVLVNKVGPIAPPPPASPVLEGPLEPLKPTFGALPLGPLAPLAHAHAPLAPLPAAPIYAHAPRPAVYTPPFAAPVLEAPIVHEAPREAFAYSFGTQHAVPVGYAAAPTAPRPVAAPIYQHGLKY